MNRKTFYDEVRKDRSLFGSTLNKLQVAGMEAILDEAIRRGTPLNWLAYIFATVYLETGARMQPIREFFAKTDAIARNYAKRFYPTKYGKPDGPYGQWYYGRGFVMITWLFNYVKASDKLGVDFVKYPEKVMEVRYALAILFDGMIEGWFTGKGLADYIDLIDESDQEDQREFANARRIVNGTDKQIKISEYALDFERILKASGYENDPLPMPDRAPIEPTKPKKPTKPTKPKRGFWANIVAFFSR